VPVTVHDDPVVVHFSLEVCSHEAGARPEDVYLPIDRQPALVTDEGLDQDAARCRYKPIGRARRRSLIGSSERQSASRWATAFIWLS
jgi:hypothetical protein